MRRVMGSGVLAALAGAAGAAQAQAVAPTERGLKAAAVFDDASPDIKLAVLALIACAAAAMALGPWLAGRIGRTLHGEPVGVGFLSALRVGAPLAALTVAVKNVMNSHVAMVWRNDTPSYLQLAGGLAELALIVFAGLLASTAAVFSLEHVRAVQRRARLAAPAASARPEAS